MSISKRPPNILFLGIDSLLARHMSCYGYRFHTTPHLDRFAEGATLFERYFCPHVPTTSGYASMLTGRDCFGTQVVALRHKGPMRPEAKTLAEILGEAGYTTTCIGFTGNAAARGFQNYMTFEGWGGDETGRAPKAHNLNEVAIPELKRLASEDQPWFLFLRHMDPHSPYLPPYPYERMFYDKDEFDPDNKTMEPVYAFEPFADYFRSWIPKGVTDKDYVIAQYDGAIAYMDACIEMILRSLEDGGWADDTIVVVTADHGETLYDHDCYFDHHGIYDVTLHVPLIIRYPGVLPEGKRLSGYTQHKDLVPTLLELADVSQGDATFDGKSLMPMVREEIPTRDCEFYITECTWMRKHGWRTPQWKLIVALEPDFHFKPPVELYNLVSDPDENHNLADEEPEVVAALRARMEAFIAKREAETGLPNPMYHQGDWHGQEGVGAFKTSQQAYDTLYIGDRTAAQRLQDKEKQA
ncbi:MAG: sulfatase [Anaerolineae bacterium]|jgi:arylsulfatase A-like enzyme